MRRLFCLLFTLLLFTAPALSEASGNLLGLSLLADMTDGTENAAISPLSLQMALSLAREGAVYHFHAKDTRVDPRNKAINGVLDTQNLGMVGRRSWVFRTVGYGSDLQLWKDMMSTLQLIGYDGSVSIEHEDALMSVKQGLEKAIAFLKDVMITDKPATAWWT